MNFDQAYQLIRKREGGYSNHPADRGGETIFGVSSKWFPDDFNTIKSLVDAGKTDEAEAYTQGFYKTNFWEPLGADQLSPEIAPLAFDAAVNHGVGAAKKMIEQSGGDPQAIINQRRDLYSNIIENDPSQAAFQDGWENRMIDNETMIGGQGEDQLQEIKAPDGTTVKFPLGMPDEEIAAIMAREYPKEEGMSFGDKAAAFGQRAQNMFTAGFGDEIEAAIQAPIYKMRGVENPYEYALNRRRQKMDDFQEQDPVAAAVADVAGGVALGVAGGSLLPKGVQAYAAQNPLKAAAGIGGASGSLYGFGAGRGGAQERAENAALVGGASFLAGPLMAKGGQLIGKYSGPLAQKAQRFKQRLFGTQQAQPQRPAQEVAREIAETNRELPATIQGQDRAVKKVSSAISDDFSNNMDDFIRAYKETDMSLAEMGGASTENLALGAAQYGQGARVADDFFKEMTQTSRFRALDSINKNIGIGDNYFAQVDDVLEAGRKKASPLYKEAFDANRSMNSNQLNRVMNAPEAKKALREVAQETRNKLQLVAKPEPELTALAKDLEGVGKMAAPEGGIAGGLPMRVLDGVKKKLDKKIGVLYDRKKMGNLTSADSATLEALETTRRELVRELDNLDVTKMAGPKAEKIGGGLYAQARAEAGEYLSVRDAMEEGRKILGSSSDSELIGKAFKKMSDSEKAAYRSGVGKALRDAIEKRTDGTNYYNTIFGSPETKRKIQQILSPKQYKQLQSDLNAEDALFDLRNRTLGNSTTTKKQIAAQRLASGFDAAEFANGNISNIPRRTFVGMLKDMTDGMDDKVARKVSEILYEKDPAKKLMIIENLTKKGPTKGVASLTKEEAKLAKKIYFEQVEKIDPYRFGGAVSSGAFFSGQTNQETMTDPETGREIPVITVTK